MGTSFLMSAPKSSPIRKREKLQQTRRHLIYFFQKKVIIAIIITKKGKMNNGTLSIISGINFCPPKPGSTVITRTTSTGLSASTYKYSK